MSEKKLKCVKCGKTYNYEINKYTCNAYGHDERFCYLYVDYPHIDSMHLDSTHFKEIFDNLLPIDSYKITLNEGNTSLKRINKFGSKIGLNNLWVKDEGENPTGSFKDRKSFIDINVALEFRIKSITNITSGNAGISLSAYAQKANIQAENIIVGFTTDAEVSRIQKYNGIIRHISQENNQLIHIPESNDVMDCSCGKDPIGIEGYKIIAWEIWFEIGIPDIILCPCGSGDGLFGIYKGFKELKKLNFTNKIPSMYAVQLEGCDTINTAIKKNTDAVILKDIKSDNIAKHIVTWFTPALPLVIHAIKDTNGKSITVTSSEILNSYQEILDLEGINISLTSASVFAAIKKMKYQINNNYNIVCILTSKNMNIK